MEPVSSRENTPCSPCNSSDEQPLTNNDDTVIDLTASDEDVKPVWKIDPVISSLAALIFGHL